MKGFALFSSVILFFLLLMLEVTVFAAGASLPLAGHWRFVDDGSVVEFTRCGEAVCAVVRQPPPKSERPADDPKCAQTLIGDMRPDGAAGAYAGWAADPSDNKRYAARLEPDGERRLRLVVRAFGGFVSETYKLEATDETRTACKP